MWVYPTYNVSIDIAAIYLIYISIKSPCHIISTILHIDMCSRHDIEISIDKWNPKENNQVILSFNHPSIYLL